MVHLKSSSEKFKIFQGRKVSETEQLFEVYIKGMGEKERKKNINIQLCFSLPLLFFVNPFPANELPRGIKGRE